MCCQCSLGLSQKSCAKRLNFFRKYPQFLLTTYTNMLYMGTLCDSERRRPSSVHHGRVAAVLHA